jgi:hypothetical protein
MSDQTRVTYERLFNIGNFNHEKFIINKEVPLGSDEATELKNAAVFCLELEEEIAKFRKVFELRGNVLMSLGYARPEQKEVLEKQVRAYDRIINSFKAEHHPQYRECKCYYCTHKDDVDREDFGDEDG